jgi:putative hydrolase of the HAD superfamily
MKNENIQGIKAISLDGDDTLWDFEKVMRYSLHQVLEELESLDPKSAEQLIVEKMIDIRNKVAKELKGKEINLGKVRLEAFKRTLKDIGRPDDDLAVKLNQVYYKHRFENVQLFDDVIPTISKLKEKYLLGLLSNGNTYPKHCGLEEAFSFVVFSQEHGVEKPDPRLFQIAVEKAGCSKEELLHVGNSLEDDIRGAVNAGIKCIWINRKGMENHLGVQVDYEINSLRELLELL